ncbi:MAG: hypothetical protein LBB85_11675 [Dysgonamonadaceae bacterium]|jgi:microcystin-dependent protein|nr:hypothetical protein [Dysgonamonadaceae bacterium]
MNKAKYTGYPTRNFPLSTEALDFIQEQIFLVAEYAKSAGGNFILSGCAQNGSNISAGTVIVDGEILPFKAGTIQSHVRIVEESEGITAAGNVYVGARTVRRVEFGFDANGGGYEWSSFVPFPTNAQLHADSATKQEVNELQNLAMPKGAIILWSGGVTNIPAGFHLCDGATVSGYGVVPDLRGRFVVGLDPTKASTPSNSSDLTENYGAAGNTGGQKAVALTTSQMPAHSHSLRYSKGKIDGTGDQDSGRYPDKGDLNFSANTENTGGGQPHENRPPYYVLAFIIKVV